MTLSVQRSRLAMVIALAELGAWRASPAAAAPPSEAATHAAARELAAPERTVRDRAKEVLFDALDRGLSDDDALLVLAAAGRKGADDDVLMARLLEDFDADRLGHVDELRALALAHPGSDFQEVLIEEMRRRFPASRARVKLLAALAARGDARTRRHAVIGLAATRELPDETCAALAGAIRSATKPVAVYAELRIAGIPCGAPREGALLDLAARVAGGPLPLADPNDLAYLCPYELDLDAQRAPIAVLWQIARSRVQPIAVRAGAMLAVRTCGAGDWDVLEPELRKDPDPAVVQAAGDADAIIIDY